MFKSLLLVFLILTAIIGCAPNNDKGPHIYQPPKVAPLFSNELDPFVNQWYSRNLHALDEKSLAYDAGDAVQLRFTWLRTFHNPVAIRVSVAADGTAPLSLKSSNGAAGYNPGQLIINRTQSLTSGQWEKVLTAASFIKTCEQPEKNFSGRDGAQWIFEYTDGETYCFVDQWSPTSGPWRDIGLMLINYSGYETDPELIY